MAQSLLSGGGRGLHPAAFMLLEVSVVGLLVRGRLSGGLLYSHS